MPRQARLDVFGTLQHVMIRGIEGSPIFEDNQAQHDFISRTGMLTKGSSGFASGCPFRKLADPYR